MFLYQTPVKTPETPDHHLGVLRAYKKSSLSLYPLYTDYKYTFRKSYLEDVCLNLAMILRSFLFAHSVSMHLTLFIYKM